MVEAEMIFVVVVFMSIFGLLMSSIGMFLFGMSLGLSILVFYISALIVPVLAALLLSSDSIAARLLTSITRP